MSILVPPPQRQIIGNTADGKPVYATLEWFKYWAQGLYERTGGSNAPTNTELVINEFDDAGIEETKHEFAKRFDALENLPPPAHVVAQNDTSPAVVELAALVDQLRKRIDALEQGLIL